MKLRIFYWSITSALAGFLFGFDTVVGLGLTAWAFFTHHHAIVPLCIFAFTGAHAVGQGTVSSAL